MHSTYSQKSQGAQRAMPGEGSGETQHVLGGDSVVKNPPGRAGGARDSGLIPGPGRPPGVRNGNSPQYCCLENPTDRRARGTAVCGAAQSQTRL